MTELLRAWSDGDAAARDRLMPLVYQELRRVAEMMRRILVDRARAHRTAKRSGRWARVTLDPALAMAAPPDVDVLDLDRALTRLAEFDARKSRIAELRFFGGLSLQETGAALGLSLATVERDWQVARAWLFNALSDTQDA